MGRREDFYRTVGKQRPNQIPFHFRLCDSLVQTFRRRTGKEDYYEYFDIPFREVSIKPSLHVPDYSKYHQAKKIDFIDEWGVGYIKGALAHFTSMVPPMEGFTDPQQVLEFPLPDVLAEYRWEGMEEKIKALKEQDYVVISGRLASVIFEPAWCLRGMENLMIDFVLSPDLAEACLDRIYEVKCKMAARWAEVGVDVIIYGDDVGTERSMMMGLGTWRQWLKPRLHGAIAAAKEVNPNVLCYYHSDGNIEDIIPDLIEIGVDILNPVQPECMDPVAVKEKYGDSLCLWGAIGTQTTMPFDTPEGVRRTVREMIDKLGYNGGFVVAPTHILEPDVPWENIIAFVEAVRGGIG